MIGYKLFRKRKDGTYGSLFINRRQKLQIGEWYDAEEHPTKGFAVRPGWHICRLPIAPHLSTKDRVWCRVFFADFDTIERPEHQGGIWYIAHGMRILDEVDQHALLRGALAHTYTPAPGFILNENTLRIEILPSSNA